MTTRLPRLLLLPLLVACSASSRTPAQNVAQTTRYTLQPVHVFGPEGRHSPSHSTTDITGSLELRGGSATLTFERTTHVGHVRCAKELRDDIAAGRVFTMQQCADENAKDHSTTAREVLQGTARWNAGALTLTLKSAARPLELTCRENLFGLACGDWTFASAGAKQFTLERIELDDRGELTGRVTLDGSTSTVELELDGKLATARGGIKRYPVGGVSVEAGGPVGRIALRCDETVRAQLACELTVDPEVFGGPSFSKRVTLAYVR